MSSTLPIALQLAAANLEHHRFTYSVLPLHEHLEAYRDQGREVGHFLTALLTNDLGGACDRADSDNLWLLPIYYAFLYNEMPSSAWGSREQVHAWYEMHRARRVAAETAEVARG